MDRSSPVTPRFPQLQRAPVWLLIGVTVAIVALFVASTIYSQHVAARLDEDAALIASNASPSIVALSATRGAALRAEVAVARAVEAAPGTGADERASAEEALKQVRGYEADYLALPFYPHERDYWQQTDRATRRFEEEVARCFADITAERVDQARDCLNTRLRPTTERLDNELEFLVRFNAAQQNRMGLEIPRLRRHAAVVAYVLDGVSALFAALLIALAVRESKKRQRLLTEFNARLEQIAASTMRITSAITHGSDQAPVLDAIVEEAAHLVDADYAAVGFVVDGDHPYESFAYHGISPAQAAAIGRFPRPVGVLAEITAHGHPLRIDDVTKHPRFGGLPNGHPPLGAFLGVPLQREGRGKGNLYLARRPGRRRFSERDEHVSTLLASQAAISMENARLYRELDQQRTRAELLSEASGRMVASLDYESTLEQAANAVLPAFADLCILHVADESGAIERTVMAASDPAWRLFLREQPPRSGRPSERHPACKALRERRPVRFVAEAKLLDLAAQDSEHPELAPQIPMQHGLSVPMLGRERMLGVITFVTFTDKPFSDRDLLFGQEAARRAALSIDNAILHERSLRAVQARDDLLAIVSHDLRNPLNAIQIATELLERRSAQEEGKRIELAGRIARATKGMMHLIDDLLSASKIESGSFTVEAKPEPVDDLVGEAVDMFRGSAATKSISLQAEVEPGLPNVMCDRGRGLQVFSNLIGNALKFTPAGGAITISALAVGEEVRISVCDTGVGIPEDEREHLFDRYWQAAHSRRAGAGLGLFIVKGIIEAHGGHAEAQTGPGGGACLCFTLPVSHGVLANLPELTRH